jgi:hypothetical protein
LKILRLEIDNPGSSIAKNLYIEAIHQRPFSMHIPDCDRLLLFLHTHGKQSLGDKATSVLFIYKYEAIEELADAGLVRRKEPHTICSLTGAGEDLMNSLPSEYKDRPYEYHLFLLAQKELDKPPQKKFYKRWQFYFSLAIIARLLLTLNRYIRRLFRRPGKS